MMTQDWKTITKQSYNSHAEDFAKHTTIYRGRLADWIKQFAENFSSGSTILDAGCGTGRDANYFVEQGFSVVGIDISDKLIEIAKKNVPQPEFLVMDFENLDFPAKKFDGIWASASLVHLPKDALLPVLQTINTLLKDNGLFFSTFRIGNEEKFTEEKRGNAMLKRFYAYYSPEELSDIFRKVGFTIEKTEVDTIDSGEWLAIFAKRS